MLMTKYERALEDALIYMDKMEGLELKSALKQSASDNGISYGEEMGSFIDWAMKELEKTW